LLFDHLVAPEAAGPPAMGALPAHHAKHAISSSLELHTKAA